MTWFKMWLYTFKFDLLPFEFYFDVLCLFVFNVGIVRLIHDTSTFWILDSRFNACLRLVNYLLNTFTQISFLTLPLGYATSCPFFDVHYAPRYLTFCWRKALAISISELSLPFIALFWNRLRLLWLPLHFLSRSLYLSCFRFPSSFFLLKKKT